MNAWEEKWGNLQIEYKNGIALYRYENIDNETHYFKRVLLDGKMVAEELLDPAMHQFLGMFRPPCPNPKWANYGGAKRWRGGEDDIPQYVTIHRYAVS